MLSLRPDTNQRARYEGLFFKHYERVLEWSLQLTRGNRWEADDLVQELYVELIRSSRDIEQIQRPDDYIFTILRNLQYARFRRSGRDAIDDLSIVDYDSVERGLQAVDRNKLLFVRADLHRVCDFVCERKNTSRTASILILRFFLGYFPNEVMAVTQSSRVAVDKALQAARREAKLDLERPGVLTPFEAQRKRRPDPRESSDNPFTLFRGLREKIAASCAGECFGQHALQLRYAGEAMGFSIEELAHLVSCAKCLDEANAILKLPLLAERSPDDSIGRDNSSGPGTGSLGAGPGAAGRGTPRIVSRREKRDTSDSKRWANAERRAREIDEHRPQRQLIAVDGDIRASQKVSAEVNELHLKLRREEKPSFIEVLSEQNVRLAFLVVSDPDMESGLVCSESRELSDGRSLDLTLSFAGETPIIRALYGDPLMLQTVEMNETGIEDAEAITVTAYRDEEHHAKPQKDAAAVWLRRATESMLRWKTALMPEINPFLASAVLLGLASAICFLLWVKSQPHISASALLERAGSSDNAITSSTPGVIYQKVRIRTAQQTFERTLYRDLQGKRRVKKHPLAKSEEQLKSSLLFAGVDWDEPLSGTSYRNWHDHHQIQRDMVSRSGDHLLTLTTRPLNDPLVLQEALTVRDDDFHPVKRTIDLRNEGTVEIAELAFNVLPWSAVGSDWFEPLNIGAVLHSAPAHPSILSVVHLPLSESELDAAELSARLALNQLGADTGERISLVRQTTGITVKGIVATEDRKQEIESNLMTLPHVVASIFTFDDLKDESAPAAQPARLQAVNGGGSQSVLEDYLVHHNWKREDAQRLSEQLLDASVSIDQDSRAIAGLMHYYDPGRTLLPASEATLNALLDRRRARLLAAISTQQSLIAQLGSPTVADDRETPSTDLAALADENLAACRSLIQSDGDSGTAPDALLERLGNSGEQLRLLAQRISAAPPYSAPKKPSQSAEQR